mmetsp:Transcript_8478/g.17556  ORF Transcript_8478/g.17556 Transcript_8478/m.17556 type:complete len:809 (-) Transcript_8478:246-2672(-)
MIDSVRQVRRLEHELVHEAAKRVRDPADLSDALSTPQMREDEDMHKRPRRDTSDHVLGARNANMMDTPVTVPRSARDSNEAFDASLSHEEGPAERTDTPLVNCYQETNMIRSDVLQLLETKTETIRKLEIEACTMQERLERAEALRDQAVRRVHQLETLATRASSAEQSRHSEVVEETTKLDKANKQLVEQVAELTRSVRRLEQELEATQSSTLAAKRELGVKEDELSTARLEKRRVELSLTQELKEARADAEHQLDRSRQLAARSQVAEEESAAAVAERNQAAEAQREVERELAAAVAQNKALQEQLALAQHLQLSAGGEGVSLREAELAATTKALREELAGYEAEVAAARRLQDQVANAHLLTERLNAAERRAERAEGAVAMAEARAAEERAAARAGAAWAAALTALPAVTAPEDVLRLVAELQREVTLANAAKGEEAQKAARLAAQLPQVECALLEAQEKHKAVLAELSDARMAASMAERHLALLTQEKASLARMVDSYEAEGRNKGGAGVASPAGGVDGAALRARAAELEAQVEAAHTQIRTLERALAESAATASDARKANEASAIAKAEAEAKAVALEREAASLAKEIAALEFKVGRGEFDRKTTKVLHLKMNPEAEASATAAERELSALRAENTSLKGALMTLEQTLSASATTTPAADDAGGAAAGATKLAVAEAEATVLRQRVADLLKKESRYKEIFKDKIFTFRDACYYLFGYKVEMKDSPDGSTTFVLRSMYDGESDSQRLVFKYKAGEEHPLQIEDTAYTTQDPEVKKQVETFIKRFRSIPGFTANLTMEQFNKHTLC